MLGVVSGLKKAPPEAMLLATFSITTAVPKAGAVVNVIVSVATVKSTVGTRYSPSTVILKALAVVISSARSYVLFVPLPLITLITLAMVIILPAAGATLNDSILLFTVKSSVTNLTSLPTLTNSVSTSGGVNFKLRSVVAPSAVNTLMISVGSTPMLLLNLPPLKYVS